MNDAPIIIRQARAEDARALLDIYTPYVLGTAITFEYEPPTEEEFLSRIEHISARFPYLVAQRGDELLGYAYAKPFHERPAFSWTAESSIYLRPDATGLGLGRRLYEELEALLEKQGIVQLVALVAATENEDEYLSNNSSEFHRHMGFEEFGRLSRCGCKFSRWYDMLWLVKQLNAYSQPQPPVISVHRL